MQLKPLIWVLAATLPGMAQAVTCQNNIPASNPDAIYTDHGNGTVTDKRTGLMWKKCLEGYSWNGSTCTGWGTVMSWSSALIAAEDAAYAGHSDWRLPNIKELRSLVEECRTEPAINNTLFPAPTSSYVWSGSPNAYSTSTAWDVHFGYGYSYLSGRSSSDRHVRLVRAGQSFDLPTNGACGTAANTATAAAPVVNLCSAGTATTLTGSSGQWQWGCNGSGGGSADACSAPYASQTLSLSAPATLLAGGTGSVNASSSAGLLVALGVSGPCSLSGSTVTGTAVGTCTVTASQAGTGDTGLSRYLPATAVTTDITVTAISTYPITATASPAAGGTVTCTPNPVTHGGNASCTATPATGWQFSAWTGACAGQAASCTLSNVQADQASVAQFSPLAAPATAQPIPTLSEWVMLLMAGLLGVLGAGVLRRRTAT